MKTGAKEIEAYENIMQSLLSLKEKASGKPKEAIGVILQTLSALLDCVRNPDEFLVSSIHQGNGAGEPQERERGNILAHAR